MEHENSDERFAALEERFSGYEVHDNAGGKVGEVNEIFVGEDGRPEYVGVKTGTSPSGSRSPLIPLKAARVDEGRRTIEVTSLPNGRIEDGPSYGDVGEITPGFEQRVRSYYGLEGGVRDPEGHGVSGDHHGADAEPSSGFTERGAGERGGGLQDADDLRVQRSEEEARVGTRGREAGAVKVRKSVRTEREQVRVPKKREEIGIERVPGEGREASGVEIGEDDEVVVVQVLEEEVVVSKRVVVKEEIRLRKKVVEDEEVVEVDLRKEEVDIQDTTGRGGTGRGTEEHEDGKNKR